MQYIVMSEGLQTGEGTPVLIVEADGMKSAPTSVRPYDPGDPVLVSLASRLLESIADHPEYNTLAHIAVSYGGLTDMEGEEVEQ